MSFFAEYKVAQRVLSTHHPVIFYAESRHYYQYMERLLHDLLQQHIPVLYITSDKKDPLLATAPTGVEAVYIHWWLGFLFPRLKAGAVIMTMTDLDNYAYKRSKEVNCYIYVFHAMVSTHLQYTGKAFFHYDAIFCPGPAHVHEIKVAEKKYGLRSKHTVDYGYPLLDVLKDQSRQHLQKGSSRPIILIAPSWYRECILETCIEELVQQLSALPYNIVIRPHPEYVKRRKKKMAALQQLAEKLSTVTFDYSPLVTPALLQADILITDRSGVAFEYALGIQQPVLFIETPLKIMNSAWSALGLPPVENQYRERMGVTLLPGELGNIKDKIAMLESMKPSFPQQMELLQKELLFNSDVSYSSGVAYVISKIKT